MDIFLHPLQGKALVQESEIGWYPVSLGRSQKSLSNLVRQLTIKGHTLKTLGCMSYQQSKSVIDRDVDQVNPVATRRLHEAVAVAKGRLGTNHKPTSVNIHKNCSLAVIAGQDALSHQNI